ncbi:pyridoxal phosphate-dependent transferase [Podospora appendiculata]|uniref:Pyridoxal phosphate-dependent transferase n=1 Tax=Podospora appendiculata TaxID=314037 RepID=A0AAE0X9L0_9PEZI|nr:pyridoxal phosphate-dependent transferase [Podospora appendiculata]
MVQIEIKLDPVPGADGANGVLTSKHSAVLHRHLDHEFLVLDQAKGNYLLLEDGRKIIDASGGAAVGSIGWGNERVALAVAKQVLAAPYCATIFFTTIPQEELAKELIAGTGGDMARAYIVNSGSEAMEAALKLARQYYLEIGQPQRSRFISRERSYHGITLGALAVGGHKARRAKFEPLLMDNVSQVSPCFAFRGKAAGESDTDYVHRLAVELDDEFQRVGPETVCAFVAEPVVGAALGCATAVAGYFKAVKAICEKHGALLILDEVMCGMGRTGTLHAWQQEGVVPDIQTIGKALSGGYQAVAGVLVNQRVVGALEKGTSAFVHGHTYQGHPAGCAAALEVQRIIREEGLLENVRQMGDLLEKRLRAQLAGHPNVGDIRGRGLFWGVELVADKASMTPFPDADHVCMEICELGLDEKYSILVYPGGGSVDGIRGDHIILAPAFNIKPDEIETIAATVARLISDYFAAKGQ